MRKVLYHEISFLKRIRIIMEKFKRNVEYRQINGKRIFLSSILNFTISGIISAYDIYIDNLAYRSMMKLSHFALTSRPAFLADDH